MLEPQLSTNSFPDGDTKDGLESCCHLKAPLPPPWKTRKYAESMLRTNFLSHRFRSTQKRPSSKPRWIKIEQQVPPISTGWTTPCHKTSKGRLSQPGKAKVSSQTKWLCCLCSLGTLTVHEHTTLQPKRIKMRIGFRLEFS